jgi:hypothetical protein
MRERSKLILGSLVGAVTIHAAFVACGHSMSTGSGAADGGADVSIFDALVDRITALVDGTTKDAKADQDAGSDGGSATCAAAPCGPVQTLPASENPSQLVTGNIVLSGSTTTAVVATGPLVLTDAAVPGGNGGTWAGALAIEPAAPSCTGPGPGAGPDSLPGYLLTVASWGTSVAHLHGGRYFVPAGQMLCLVSSGQGTGLPEVQWAGFRPYS